MTSSTTAQIGDFWMELTDLKLLRALVKSHRMTHRDLAVVAGYKSHTYIGKLLRGQARTIEPTPAARIAHYFDIGVDELFTPKSSRKRGRPDQSTGRTAATRGRGRAA